MTFLFTGCKALFWQDSVNWQGGSWQDENAFVEIQLEYESKSSWNPLNQNALSRNYHTRLLLHRFGKAGDTIQTSEIAHYPGWTLNGTLFLAGDWIIASRGLSNGYGTEDRELIMVRLNPSNPTENKPRVLLTPDMNLIAAFPDADGKRLVAVLTDATMQSPTGKIFLDFYDLAADGTATPIAPRISQAWHGAPGLPNLSWAKDGSQLYMQRNDAIQAFVPGQTKATPAASFPQCFRQTKSGHSISETGRFFFRTPEGEIGTRNEQWLAWDAIPSTDRIDKIGAGCP